jgi:hypothetical protein
VWSSSTVSPSMSVVPVPGVHDDAPPPIPPEPPLLVPATPPEPPEDDPPDALPDAAPLAPPLGAVVFPALLLIAPPAASAPELPLAPVVTAPPLPPLLVRCGVPLPELLQAAPISRHKAERPKLWARRKGKSPNIPSAWRERWCLSIQHRDRTTEGAKIATPGSANLLPQPQHVGCTW